MSSHRQNLCPPEFNFLPWRDMLLSVGNYSVDPPNNESCHRVFDSHRLVTTGSDAHIKQEEEKRTLRIPEFTQQNMLMLQSFQHHTLINLEPI